MRKYIVPILLAVAVVFTATQAMALDNSKSGSFVEDHLNGDHYKHTDALENGGHGGEVGGFQLSSAWLKDLKSFVVEGDGSYGYSTGNPFRAGWAGGATGETEDPLVAPNYTMPCPEWTIIGGASKGTCPANAFVTDPQTEDPYGDNDGVVLDDLYQVVASDDSGTQTSTLTNLIVGTRFLNQTIDILFFNGKRGIISLGNTVLGGSEDGVIDSGRHFNIDQTLDQDIADYFTEYDNPTTTLGAGIVETAGIFGKLTQLFQMAGKNSSMTSGYASPSRGCASAGGNMESDSLGVVCPSSFDGMEYNDDEALGILDPDFSTGMIDQWLVSDLADLAYSDGKPIGSGVDQRYRSWFRDGGPKDFDYTYEYPAGHGEINKTVKPIEHPFDP